MYKIFWTVRISYFLESLQVVNSEYLVFHWLFEILIEKFRIPKFFWRIQNRAKSALSYILSLFLNQIKHFNCLPKVLFTQSCLNHKHTFLDIWIYLSPKLKIEAWYKWKSKYGIKDDIKKVFNRQNSPDAAPWYTEYQKLEYAGHGVSKLVCEHIGCKAPKARDHLVHMVRDIRATRITKERKEVI